MQAIESSGWGGSCVVVSWQAERKKGAGGTCEAAVVGALLSPPRVATRGAEFALVEADPACVRDVHHCFLHEIATLSGPAARHEILNTLSKQRACGCECGGGGCCGARTLWAKATLLKLVPCSGVSGVPLSTSSSTGPARWIAGPVLGSVLAWRKMLPLR